MAASAPPAAPGYSATTVPMRNGLGVAALACGLAGILLGQIPLLFLGSGTPCSSATSDSPPTCRRYS